MSILLPLKPTEALQQPQWETAPEHPLLPPTELHIWRTRMEAPRGGGQRGRECAVSREQADRLKVALFRKDILERYTAAAGGGPASSVLRAPGSGLRMAVAQCEEMTLIAVSRDVRCMGLDVERVREDIAIEEMAGGFLDARAQWDLRVTWSLQEKAWKFFQFWTSNEACEQAALTRSAASCHVRGFSPGGDFVAALAVGGGPDARVLYWDWIG